MIRYKTDTGVILELHSEEDGLFRITYTPVGKYFPPIGALVAINHCGVCYHNTHEIGKINQVFYIPRNNFR